MHRSEPVVQTAQRLLVIGLIEQTRHVLQRPFVHAQQDRIEARRCFFIEIAPQGAERNQRLNAPRKERAFFRAASVVVLDHTDYLG